MIQRYCISYGELQKADFDGGLVMYEDYLKLEKELADYKEWMTEPIVKFQTEFQEMKKELTELREEHKSMTHLLTEIVDGEFEHLDDVKMYCRELLVEIQGEFPKAKREGAE